MKLSYLTALLITSVFVVPTWAQQSALNERLTHVGAYENWGFVSAISGDDVMIHDTDKRAVLFYKSNDDSLALYQTIAEDSLGFGKHGQTIAIFGDYAVIQSSDLYVYIIFRRDNGLWQKHQLLTVPQDSLLEIYPTSVTLSEHFLFMGCPNEFYRNTELELNGVAYVYELQNEKWNYVQNITNPGGDWAYHFARNLSVSGEYAMFNSFRTDRSGSLDSVYVYKHSDGKWGLDQVITGESISSFGYSFDVYGDYAIVGAPHESDTGAAYIYQNVGGKWIKQQRLSNTTGRSFGRAVAISKNYAIVSSGNQGYNHPVYIYRNENGNWVEKAQIKNHLS